MGGERLYAPNNRHDLAEGIPILRPTLLITKRKVIGHRNIREINLLVLNNLLTKMRKLRPVIIVPITTQPGLKNTLIIRQVSTSTNKTNQRTMLRKALNETNTASSSTERRKISIRRSRTSNASSRSLRDWIDIDWS